MSDDVECRTQAPRGRVLVVDDDTGLREAVLRALRKKGYEAVGATDGLQGIHRLQHEAYDVIVTDLQMPRLDGLGLLREVRRLGYPQPLVVQTTVLDAPLEDVLRRAGAFRVLRKSDSLETLLQSVAEAQRAALAARASVPGA